MDKHMTEIIGRESDHDLLRKRAEQLAEKVIEENIEVSKKDKSSDYVTFSMGGDLFGIETVYVKEVLEPDHVVSVPCTPDFITGVISIRGQIAAVIDLCRFWGKGSAFKSSHPRILMIGDGEIEFGIAVENISDVVPIFNYEHKPFAEGLDAVVSYASGITSERMILLKGKSLLEEQSFVVDEFVGNI